MSLHPRDETSVQALMEFVSGKFESVRTQNLPPNKAAAHIRATMGVTHEEMLNLGFVQTRPCTEAEMMDRVKVVDDKVVLSKQVWWHPEDLSRVIVIEFN